jgi:hypothetical protein
MGGTCSTTQNLKKHNFCAVKTSMVTTYYSKFELPTFDTDIQRLHEEFQRKHVRIFKFRANYRH